MDDYFLLCEFTKNLSILYVEDDPNFQKETASLLGYFFDNIELARNGVDAIKQYQTRLEENKTFDLVITDIVMPKVEGNEYRLIVKIQYKAQFVFIRFVGTHKEYDKIDTREV